MFRDTVYVCDCPCPKALYSICYCIVQRASQYRTRWYCQNLNLATASQFGSRVSIWQPRFNLTAASPKQSRKFEKSPFSLLLEVSGRQKYPIMDDLPYRRWIYRNHRKSIDFALKYGLIRSDIPLHPSNQLIH